MLRGLRFQKRLRVLPGVRINLSKSGASTSIGPRGADVNIGPHGISTNAGIPGTGLSYRSKVSKPHSALIGVVALVLGLSFAAWKNLDHIAAWLAPAPTAQQTSQTPAAEAPVESTASASPSRRATASPNATTGIRAQAAKLLVPGGTIYVRRAGSVLRETEKTSGATLKKLEKGAAVVVVKHDDDWTQVKVGGVTGWMRTSVLGPKP
ncbi:MAG: DUF4236 domain-containing protein [Alphaproteobacteria bacterium]|nr:DUF4236 domain-containing protein [Alphaproteobacteria bacterium]